MDRLSDVGRSRPDGTPPDRFEEWEDADPAARHRARRQRSRRIFFGMLGLAASLLWLYQGTHWASELMVGRATERREAGDLSGARSDVEWALYWEPHSPSALEERAAIGRRQRDRASVAQAVRDLETRLEQLGDPKSGGRRSFQHWRILSDLAHTQQQLALCTDESHEAELLHAKGIANCTKAIELAPAAYFPLKNARAYMRAVAGGGRDELLAALQDVDRAIQDLKRLTDRGELDPLDQEQYEAAFFDTRAYVLFLLGRHAEAEPDIQKALAAMADARMHLPILLHSVGANKLRSMEEQLRESDAVLRHHRALVWQALGKTEQAEAEFKTARDMGFDPKRGVY